MTYHLYYVVLDNEPRYKLACPGCGTPQLLDDDQLHGRISTECSMDDCDYHDTVDFAAAIGGDNQTDTP